MATHTLDGVSFSNLYVIGLIRSTQIRIDNTRVEVTRMRLGVKKRVEQAIQVRFGRKYTVEFFGSTWCALHILFCLCFLNSCVSYGVSHLDSDLDMVVIVSHFYVFIINFKAFKDPDAPEGWKHNVSRKLPHKISRKYPTAREPFPCFSP